MKPLLLLVHGWGFDAGFWGPVREILGADAAVVWDLGFFGAPSRPPLPEGRPVVAVGHSFGLLWLLHHRPVAWRALVAVNGFACFTRREGFPEGVEPRVLSRMISRFAEEPVQVVADFRARCGCVAPLPAMRDDTSLLSGLQALARWDERPAQVDLALCGRNDALVSMAMSKASMPEERIIWHDGGHLLPLEDPGWCAAQLRAVLEGGP
jgi:pimeloyl-[acyl-carrier protein] methyl ester esterase